MAPANPPDGTPLNIRWIVDWKAEGPSPGTSPIASMRYRVLLPARALASFGHRTEIVKLQDLRAGLSLDWSGIDVLVVGKLFVDVNIPQFQSDAQHLLDACAAAREAGAVVAADVNDDHFERPIYGDYWKALVNAIDVCAVGSPAMGKAVAKYTSRPIEVVADPLAAPKGAPRVHADRTSGAVSRFFRSEPLKLVWYGNENNVLALIRWVDWLASTWTEMPLDIKLVTRPVPKILEWVESVARGSAKKLRVQLVEWSEEAQWRCVEESDVVLVPSDPADPAKAVKTANRLTDALYAGRYVIASPIPAYVPFADVADLGDNPVMALHAYLKDAGAARERIARGQRLVEQEGADAATASRWLDVFRHRPTKAQPDASAPITGQPRYLNLGCGDKILDGYVNVDVASSRGGRQPDVVCDIRNLSVFEDESTDRVMAIHVIEHFWRWEVEGLLQEWMRVLRSGGELILECPNLASACAELLRDPGLRSRPGIEGQTTMWALYGDPQWKDPLMMHRWGYTPASLAELMRAVGLVNVRQEPAQYKMREPRDMRLVGIKP